MKRLIEVALCTSIVPGLPPFPPRAFRAVRSLLSDDLPSATHALAKLEQTFRLAGEARLARLEDFRSCVDRLQEQGISVVLEGDASYPRRWLSLGNAKPVAIFVAGDLSVFGERLAGVVGSRQASEESKTIARSIGNLAKQHGFGIVSGGAKGVDEIAVRAALDSGAKSAVICADSMTRHCAGFRSEISSKSVCICSPFSPQSSFSAGNAMARNKLVYRSAELTAAVEFTPGSGGTWAGAVEALKNGRDRVAVFASFAHSKKLADRGAVLAASANDFFALIDAAIQADLFTGA